MGQMPCLQQVGIRVTDPITCPQCRGRGWESFGAHDLTCRCCQGRGTVGGPDDPVENPPPPPAEPPPLWEDRRWQDSAFAHISCRYCLDSGKVSHLDRAAGTLATIPCVCTTKEPPLDP